MKTRKAISFITLLIVVFNNSLNAQLSSKVDERFELTSIAFRLAGAEEDGYRLKEDVEIRFKTLNH